MAQDALSKLHATRDWRMADGATGRIKTETEYQPLAQVIRTRLGALLPGGVLFSNTGDDS